VSAPERVEVDPRLPSQIQAAQTGRRARALRPRVPPDPRLQRDGGLRGQPAYDSEIPPPRRAADDALARVQVLGVEETYAWVAEYLARRPQPLAKAQRARGRAVRAVLAWLAEHPGETWEDRWLLSGLDAAPNGSGDVVAGATQLSRAWATAALSVLVDARVVRPSYAWMLRSKQYRRSSSARFLDTAEPDVMATLRALPAYARAPELACRNAETCIARVLIRTGKRLGQLSGEDLLAYADVVRTSMRHNKEHLAWELLVALGPLAGEPPTLRAAWAAAGSSRQHTVQTLVARYGLPPSGVLDLLVDYLGELKVGMDYGSLQSLSYRLVRLFWGGVLAINPDQDDLRLSPDVAASWREQLTVTLDGRPRSDVASTFFAVRALYRDLAEWSHEEPERWAIWVAPSPVPRHESRRASKASKQRRSRMQARTRQLTPFLPQFTRAAADLRDEGARLLTAALAVGHGERFNVDGIGYERHDPPVGSRGAGRNLVWAREVQAPNGARTPPSERGLVCVSRFEADAFWAWALVEVLRETGVRIEELLELTQLSLRHYVAPATNTIVPLLHIVPSKTDAERLVPMSPDLVKVLVDVQRRARGNDPTIPLSVRYDHNEKVFGDPLPHLFARMMGPTQSVLSIQYVRKLLDKVADRAGLSDGGLQVRFTPHDFRRLFATDLVGSGLPLHIVSSLLGHLNLETTRGYTAVFPEHVVQAHHAFIERRRQTRPDGEMRPATAEEWHEFEQHFLLRKVALGDCHRPYGTPCVHEHACTRCRFLQVDPAQVGRLEEMTANAEARLAEARERVWLGEVSALEESLKHLRQRRAEVARFRERAGKTALLHPD
jgi:site-specific recombinase XerC